MVIGIIDIETTGFLGDGGYIVEVGLVELHTSTGKIKPVFDSVCRERGMTAKDRNAWIFKNSDLTIEAVRGARDLTELKPQIQTLLNGFDGVTAFNKSFDFGFLRNRGFEIKEEWPCPMLMATEICKLPKKGRGAHYGGYKWPNVEEAWRHFFPDRPYKETHRGCDDAMHEAEIVYELFKLGLMAK